MTYFDMTHPIAIDVSAPDNRSLIMPHQQKAVEAMTDYYKLDEDIENRNGIVVMPTGSGKTFTAVNWLLSQGVAKGYRIIWLVHRQELVEQTYREFRKQAPLLKETDIKRLRVYPISGAHMHMSSASRADVYVCSIASVANKYGYRFIERMLGAQGKRKCIVVIDEAHHAVASNYQKVVNRITKLNPNRVLLGLTATPKRMQDSQQRHLQKMFNIDSNIQQGIGCKGYVYEVTLKQLLASGFLAEPKYIPVETELIGEVEYNCTAQDEAYFMQFGDLPDRIKNRIGKSSARNGIIVKQYLDHRDMYGKTLVFAYDQNHAETLCEEFTKVGVSCDYAISNRGDAQEVIQRFKKNEFDVLINVQIMTEGSDVPDIQTVFLTRETNSDSLLMQMIGRGLRGEKAGGTKVAYIVAFHDTWNRFEFWMDPGKLDVFDEDSELEETNVIAENEEIPEIDADEVMMELLAKILKEGPVEKPIESLDEGDAAIEVNQKDLYLKLYHLMRASLLSEEREMIYPCGWYSLIDEDGNDYKLLVFGAQEKCYKDIERNISLISEKTTVDAITRLYFGTCEIVPSEKEIQYLIDYVSDSGEMPMYFELADRAAYDPRVIAETVKKLDGTATDIEEWLKKLYDSAPILQEIYRVFYAFKNTILDAMKDSIDATIITSDDRKEYELVENYYNLSELLGELKQQYPKLKIEHVIKVEWSKSIVREWWALCEIDVIEDKLVAQLHVNRLLSSPEIDREVIKYLMFHELLHANGYWDHNEDFRSREWQYPNSAELDGIIDSLGQEYNLDIHYKNSVASESHSFNTIEAIDEPTFNPDAKGIQKGFKYCRNCGNKIPEDAKFCDKCGSKTDY